MSMMYVRNLVDLHLKYYADLHDVDEDLTSISVQGDQWRTDGFSVGIARRSVNDGPSSTSGVVASKCNKNSTPTMRVEF